MSDDINLVNAKLLEIYSMSLNELNKYIIDGNFVVSKSVDYKQITLSDLPGDWKLVHSNPREDSDNVILFIIPKGQDAQKLWEMGQFKIAREAGLSSRQARRWTWCRDKFKYDYLETVIEILKDDNLVKAFLNYSTHMESTEYHEWVNKYKIFTYSDAVWYKQNKERIKTLLKAVLAPGRIKSILENENVENNNDAENTTVA